jgi:hypothetical protein
MPRLDVRRILAVLLLLTLAPTVSWAGERAISPRKEASFLGGTLLSSLWSVFKSVWAEEGSSLDPDGQPRPNEGSDLDPSGSPTSDNGSDGACRR